MFNKVNAKECRVDYLIFDTLQQVDQKNRNIYADELNMIGGRCYDISRKP